jgi:ZIP family zinc transporter
MLIAALLPVFSTLLGGFAVFRFRHQLHSIMAFAAGVLVATALLELAPEAISLVGAGAVPPMILIGFLAYSALESVVERSTHEHVHGASGSHQHSHDLPLEAEEPLGGPLSLLGPAGLIFHSTMDGVAIGLGFVAAPTVGLIVTLAVIGHDFADGLNVVTLALAAGAGRRRARILLVADAVVVPVGVLIGFTIGVDRHILGLLLGAFAGVFIAIGAGHLLPEARHEQSDAGLALTAAALAGALVVLVIRTIAMA